MAPDSVHTAHVLCLLFVLALFVIVLLHYYNTVTHQNPKIWTVTHLEMAIQLHSLRRTGNIGKVVQCAIVGSST